MKEIKTTLYRHLETAEFQGILDAVNSIEKAFGKKVFGVHVNAQDTDKNNVWGIAFSFDLLENKREKTVVDPIRMS